MQRTPETCPLRIVASFGTIYWSKPIATIEWSDCGILSWGSYVPTFRLDTNLISDQWGGQSSSSKSLANIDEDATTLGLEATRRSLRGCSIAPDQLGCLLFGSESKPYSAKASAITIAEAIGATPWLGAADLESACRGGIEGLFRLVDSISNKRFSYAILVASDVAHAAIGDALELSASAAAVAFVLGPATECSFVLSYSVTYCTDTHDFHRRDGSSFPVHGGRFTGEPAYFRHTLAAAQEFMQRTETKPQDYRFAVFHQPNAKFPIEAARRLGFSPAQYEPIMFADRLGNPYAANSPLGISLAIRQCDVGDKVLVTSYGSGAGSDCFAIQQVRPRPTLIVDDKSANSGNFVRTYADYLRMTRRIKRETE